MKEYKNSVSTRLGKTLSSPLSQLFANSITENFTNTFEAYCCFLLGKGAGSGWAMDTEVNAAKSVINSAKPVLFDVGANIGDWSLLFQKAFPSSTIFLFEPQPTCQKLIKELPLLNATLIPNAASSEKGLVTVYTSGETAGVASLHQRTDTYCKNKTFSSFNIEAITIDSIIESYNIESIDFMKMDIEGHELDALKGAEQSLKKKKIKALSFEFGCANLNSRTFFRDFWNFLSPLGYKIYRILPSSRLLYIEKYYEDCEYFRGNSNYIAVLKKVD